MERHRGIHWPGCWLLSYQLTKCGPLQIIEKLTRYHCFVKRGSFMLMSISLMSLYPLFLRSNPSCCSAIFIWNNTKRLPKRLSTNLNTLLLEFVATNSNFICKQYVRSSTCVFSVANRRVSFVGSHLLSKSIYLWLYRVTRHWWWYRWVGSAQKLVTAKPKEAELTWTEWQHGSCFQSSTPLPWDQRKLGLSLGGLCTGMGSSLSTLS